MNRDPVSLCLLILFLSHYCLASPYKHLQTEKHAPPIILAGEQVASQDIMLLLLNLSQRCLQQFWQSKHRAIRGQRLRPHKRRKRTLMAFAACSGQFLFKVCVPFCWFKQPIGHGPYCHTLWLPLKDKTFTSYIPMWRYVQHMPIYCTMWSFSCTQSAMIFNKSILWT